MFWMARSIVGSSGREYTKLRSMQERVNLLEGQMAVQSLLNKGTKISIEIPIKESIEEVRENTN